MTKYNYSPAQIPQNKKLEVNEKLLWLIQNGLTEDNQITGEDVYNSYSSIGGLHGLEFNDFSSYHAFSEEKKKFELGQFFTPHEMSRFLVESLNIGVKDIVVDLTCGSGNFFNHVPVEANCYGVEVEHGSYQVAHFLYPEAHIVNEDIRSYEQNVKANVMVLNPPFNLSFRGLSSQLYVMDKAFDGLHVGGVLGVIVPKSFLADDFLNKSDIAFMNERFHFLGQWLLSSDAFKSVGANIDTKLMYFAKRSNALTDRPYSTVVNVLPDFTDKSLQEVQQVVKDFCLERDQNRLRIRQEEVSTLETSEAFMYTVNKYLYDIEAHPLTKDFSVKAHDYLARFLSQKKPATMDYREWDKIKITENKVLAYLKRGLALQSVVERDEIRLVKTSTGLKLKGYSRKTRKQLKDEERSEVVPFTELYVHNPLGFERLVNKKRKKHENQILPYDQISVEDFPVQKNFVENLILQNKENGSQIILNDVQQEDTIKMLTKNYGYLQWDTGAGKTVSAMAQMRYRLQHNTIRNIYVVSNAIAINNTLEETFTDFGFNVQRVRNLSDLNSVVPGQVVLFTFDALNKYRRFVRKHVKMNSQKVMFILDEADNISNVNSLRYKSVLSCFRKTKHKLLMSGTSTRNNVAESFTAFELLYNNSENFPNHATFMYEEHKKNTIVETDFNQVFNPRKGELFSAYTKGFLEFRGSFSPAKTTVFGVTKNNQGVYNKDELRNLISYTMITRSFEEVSHKDLYRIQQETVSFTSDERVLYDEILDEFHKFHALHTSTGSSQKDTMLRIIQQLNALLRAPVQPNKYRAGLESSKYPKLKELISQNNEWVVVGATNVGVVNQYAAKIRKDFPEREVFIITGSHASLNKRKKIIKDFKASKNGILVCTQQSLSSSMNIDFANIVVLLQLQWNFPVMKQFFTRFVRFTSEYPKTIIFLLNNESIETNLLKLLLSKEKMNLFMKNSDMDDAELSEYFGIGDDFFESLFSKQVDDKGKSYIAWGSQQN